jgi:DNA polymerase (family X)
MQPVPPERREGRNEIAQALAGNLPDLVTDHDIAGILHAHTDRSDGLDTLETMAEAALSRGYEYVGLSDHSRSAHYAGGLSQQEIAEQQAEADGLNRRSGERFRIFKGVESDILADGSLDYPNEVLETFDLSWQACTAVSTWTAHRRPNASFARCPIPTRRSSGI